MDDILKEDLSKNKELTPELKKKIRKIFGKNILIIGTIFLYMLIITFAFYKMELNTLENDLKVLSTRFFSVFNY